jgi:hypothetical protein
MKLPRRTPTTLANTPDEAGAAEGIAVHLYSPKPRLASNASSRVSSMRTGFVRILGRRPRHHERLKQIGAQSGESPNSADDDKAAPAVEGGPGRSPTLENIGKASEADRRQA